MPGITPIYGLPFHELSDPPSGPDQGQDLANAVEAELDRIDGEVDTAQAAADAAQTDATNAQATADAALPKANIVYGATNVTSDADGNFTIPHTLGVAPGYVAMSATNGTRRAVAGGLTAHTATDLGGSLRQETGGAAPNETREVLYFAII